MRLINKIDIPLNPWHGAVLPTMGPVACQLRLGGKMENRWSNRRILEMGVDIYHDGTKLTTGMARDMGLGGVFLDAAITGRIKVNDHVDLVFHLIENGLDIKHALHARIKRISDDGMGLQFDYFDTAVFRALQQIMNYHEEQDQAVSVYS